jgi:universal stress protein E
VILACVDPVHEHDQPAALDVRILDEARQFAERMDGDLHALHCYDVAPAIAAAGASAAPATPAVAEQLAAEIRDSHAEHFNRLTASHGMAPDHAHLVAGPATAQLPGMARQLKADLLVMGAVCRSRFQRAIVGSTAERVLDRLPCDVLVVKPPRFESPVTFRAQARDFQEMH